MGGTCQGLLIAPGNIIDLDLLLPFSPAAVSVSALLPPHSSGVLPGHITGHCGTAWRLQHSVFIDYALGLGFLFIAAAKQHTHTHTCSGVVWRGGGGGGQSALCSASL